MALQLRTKALELVLGLNHSSTLSKLHPISGPQFPHLKMRIISYSWGLFFFLEDVGPLLAQMFLGSTAVPGLLWAACFHNQSPLSWPLDVSQGFPCCHDNSGPDLRRASLHMNKHVGGMYISWTRCCDLCKEGRISPELQN